MITNFSPKVQKELNSYVYVYSDPDTKKPFYIGKGTGNRCFDHLKTNSQNNQSVKSQKIQSLIKAGKSPIIDILIHGLADDTALKVEAAIIELLDITNLTNIQRGHHSKQYGKMSVEEIIKKYDSHPINKNDITDNIILLCINQTYKADITPIELYDATRAYWDVNLANAKKTKYAFALYNNIVVEVYEIIDWLPACSTFNTRLASMSPKDKAELSKKYEFIGNIAPDNVRNKFIHKNASSLFTTQGVFQYFLP